MRVPFLAILSLAVAASPLDAQQTKVVPPGMDFVEGTNFLTYPFGQTDGAIQVLWDAERITTPGTVALLLGIRFRPHQPASAASGYSKAYTVTAYTVTTAAAAMVADPTTNIAGASPTVLWSGVLNIPPIVPQPLAPGPWSIHVPFTTPYVFDSTQGNLLLLVETADLLAPNSGTYRIDYTLFRNSTAEGLVAGIDGVNCANTGGQRLTIAASAGPAIVGGTLGVSLTATSNGAFPLGLALFGFARQDIDLSILGLTGCTMFPVVAATLPFAENPGGGYPSFNIGIPLQASIEGTAVLVQALALAAPLTLADAVFSNALGVRIGAAAPPARRAMAATRFPTGWGIGTAGEFVPVVQFDGVFP